MIIFNNWQITAQRGVIARQFDNLSRRLEVVGELPEGYTWDLLVQVGNALDIITLEPMEGGVGVTLTADQLSQSGYYSVQLRGTRGEEVRHTNVESVFIPASLSGSGQWPTVPSEFIQAEQRIREIATHPPVPGENGFWMLWDPDADQYAESQLPLPESGGSGTSDHTQLSNRDAGDQHPISAITGLEEALDGKQPTGNYLTDQDIDATLKEAGKAADAAAVGDALSKLSAEIGNLPSGVSSNAKTLLITILRNGVYSSDQSENIAALETALESGGSGDSGETSVYVYSLEKGNAILIDGGASGVYNGTVGVNITQATRVTLLAKTGDADLWCVTSSSPFSKLDTECYPIPVPADATGVNISVSDGNVLGPAFYTYDGTTLTRTLDSGWQTSGAYSLTFEPGTYQYLSVNTKLATGISYTDVDKPTSYVVEFTK